MAVFIFIQSASAQVFFENYTAEKGFPNTNVAAIIQDNKGFIWLGSSEGLSKFDGKNFQVFRHSDTDSSSVCDNNINCLFIDSKGFLWVGTRAGLSRYNSISNNFKNFYHDNKNKNSLSSNDIWSIAEDNQGKIWVGTLDAGLNSIAFVGMNDVRISHYSQDSSKNKSLSNNAVWAIHFDDKGYGWVGTEKGVNIFRPEDNGGTINFLHYTNHPENPSSIADNFVWRIYADDEKNIWLSSLNGTLDYVPANADRQNISFTHLTSLIENQFNIKLNSVYDFCKDQNGHAWISVNENGLLCTNISIQNKIANISDSKYFLNEPTINHSLVNNMVWKTYRDKDGLIWCGTQKGVSVYDPYKEQFDYWQTNRKKIIPQNKIITSIYDDGNNTWLSSEEEIFVLTNNGIKKIERVGSTFTAVYNNLSVGFFAAGYGGLMYSNPKAVKDFTTGNAPNLTLLPVERIIKNFPSFNRVNFLKPVNGELFAGGSAKLVSINLSSLLIKDYGWMEAIFTSLAQKIFRDVCLQEKYIWLGTDDGLFLFNGDEKKFVKVYNTTSSTLASNRINCLFYDDKENVFIGTAGGLNIYNTHTSKIISLFEKDGLPDNNIQSITKDNKGSLWLATRNGLCSYNPITKEIKNFSTATGLSTSQLNYVHKTWDGNTLLIGCDNGINTFNLITNLKKPNPPVICFTDFLIHGKSILNIDTSLAAKLLEQQPIKLNYQQNYFTLQFSALSFNNPTANIYAYQLEGFDTGWINIGNKNTATYTNLSAGTYLFKVKACNAYGVWNNNGIAISITITPPWWRTNLFYVACVLLLFGIIYSIYRIRLNRILADQKMRNKISSDLHDDIGSSLSGISIYSELAKAKAQQQNADLYRILTSISENTKITQQNMQDIVWSINPYNDSFDKIITRMKMFSAEILEPKAITLGFKTDELLGNIEISPDKRKNLFLIFKEAVNNCAKYSACKNVVVCIYKEQKKIFLTVQDDGKGFTTSEVKKGNGLRTMEARAKDMNGIFSIKSQEGKGTLIELNFYYPKR